MLQLSMHNSLSHSKLTVTELKIYAKSTWPIMVLCNCCVSLPMKITITITSATYTQSSFFLQYRYTNTRSTRPAAIKGTADPIPIRPPVFSPSPRPISVVSSVNSGISADSVISTSVDGHFSSGPCSFRIDAHNAHDCPVYLNSIISC